MFLKAFVAATSLTALILFFLSAAASVNSRKDKSLRVMSQKFVMLFLVSTPQIVSLEVAAKILIGEDQLEDLDKSKFKSK